MTRGRFIAVRLALSVLLLGATSRCALASDFETNVWRRAVQRLSFSAFADIESAYWARGAIVDKRPFSAQYADLSVDLDPFGRVGGYAWSVSSLSKSGQSATRRNAYNEVDYGVYYGYGLELAEGWTLDTTVAKKWVTLPGYRPHASTISEWNFSQALKNPYVTPWCLIRRGTHPNDWTYYRVGAQHGFSLMDGLTLTPIFYAELGDERHFNRRYGQNVRGRSYHSGPQSLVAQLELAWKVRDWISVTATLTQFGLVSEDARASIMENGSRGQRRRDLTIFGLGVVMKF